MGWSKEFFSTLLVQRSGGQVNNNSQTAGRWVKPITERTWFGVR